MGPCRWVVRRPEPQDAEALGRMHDAGRREAYGHLLPTSYWAQAPPELLAAQWRRLMTSASPGERLALAEQAGHIIGLAAAGAPVPEHSVGHPAVRSKQLYVLYVLRRHHGSGVAQELLEAVLTAGEAAQLWVAEANPRAQAFYRRNGFAADGTRMLDPGFAGLAEIRMVR